MSNPGHGEPGRVRAGWKLNANGKWEPVPPDPKPPSPRTTIKVSVKGLDESLEASHRRMQKALAVETLRLEAAAKAGPLTGLDIEVLARLSTTWRTLVQNEPTQDYSKLTDEQIRAKLAEVKR